MNSSKFKFNIGDRVRIRKNSEYYLDTLTNPKDMEGSVVRYNDSYVTEYKYVVQWDNYQHNSYRDNDLDLVTPTVNNSYDIY